MLPLNDHEVVITFDDSPLPPYTDIILKILASQCVRANYFLIGRMAQAYPFWCGVARRLAHMGEFDRNLANAALPARVASDIVTKHSDCCNGLVLPAR